MAIFVAIRATAVSGSQTLAGRRSHARSGHRRRHSDADRACDEGVAERRSGRRSRRGPAARAGRAQPGGRFRRDERHHDGLRLPRRRAGLQHRPQRAVARRHRSSRPGGHGQPVLRVVAADDPDGLPRHQGGRGRSVHRGGRGVRVARRGPDVPVDESTASTARTARATTCTSRWGSRPRTWPSAARSRRESQDEWAALSQQRALAARDSGHFDREIVGVDIPETPRRRRRRRRRAHGHARRRAAPRHDGGEARRSSSPCSSPMAR